jgi:hypothetical protein
MYNFYNNIIVFKGEMNNRNNTYSKNIKIIEDHTKFQNLVICLGEAAGSMIFTIGINWSNKMQEPKINTFFSAYSIEALSVSISYFIAFLIFGPVSLGHYNPAITVADYINRLSKEENLGRKSFSFFTSVILF